MTHILVVEDERAIREEVVDWLRFEDFEVSDAANGREGLDAALAKQPGLILCDITMPEMDGYQLLLELRKHPETTLIPFIFMTARADRSFMRHGMELGADDYVTKPFTRSELLAAIHTRLGRQEVIAEAHNRELEDTKIKLSQVVSNELRGPLASVSKVKQIIEHQMEQLAPDEIRGLLETLSMGTERLHHLVEQMVYLTYLETGQLSQPSIFEKPSVVYMWQIIPSIVDLGRRFADRHAQQEINLDVRDGDAAVIADTPALKHALGELIGNALTVSPENGVVSVTEWKTDEWVCVSITDHGTGIPPAAQLQSLLPYKPISSSGQQEGIGLSLTIAARIIEAHGGELKVNSVEGKGTQMVVTLPMLGSS